MLLQAFLERSQTYLERLARMAPAHVLAHALAEQSPAGTIARILSALHYEERDLDAEDRAIAAALAEGTRFKEGLLDQAGGAYTAEQFGELLHIRTRQGVAKGRKEGRFLGVPVAGGGYVYPKVQVTREGLLPGLKRYLTAFGLDDPWTQLAVLLAPTDRLGGRTPLDALRERDVDGAVRVARSYGEHGA